MDTKNTGLDLSLIRYRGGEDNDYLYFWTNKENGVDVHVSPMFESEEEAKAWIEDLKKRVDLCMLKLEDIRTG